MVVVVWGVDEWMGLGLGGMDCEAFMCVHDKDQSPQNTTKAEERNSPPLRPEPAQDADRLRGQAHVAHHRDAPLHDLAHRPRAVPPALDLDRVDEALWGFGVWGWGSLAEGLTLERGFARAGQWYLHPQAGPLSKLTYTHTKIHAYDTRLPP